MKSNNYLFLLLLLGLLTACTTPSGNVIKEIVDESPVEKIEVYHFHSTRQCSVCKTIGDNLDETTQRYFLDEVESGKIIYGHINIQDPANREITELYGATGTSLWIGVHDNTGFRVENNVGVWYKLNDKEGFIIYLKELIDKRLSGDMN